MKIRVETARPETMSTDWTAEAKKARRWGVRGEIVAVKTGHGLCYEVRHDDGSLAFYEPRELRLVE
jgi:hypothetical protein